MPVNAPLSAAGKVLSISTWLRRMSRMSNIGSLPTGQTSTQAPQLVQAQTALSLMAKSSPARTSRRWGRAKGKVGRVSARAVIRRRDHRQPPARVPVAADAGGTRDMARSASAVMVSAGLTPGLAEIAEPSTT